MYCTSKGQNVHLTVNEHTSHVACKLGMIIEAVLCHIFMMPTMLGKSTILLERVGVEHPPHLLKIQDEGDTPLDLVFYQERTQSEKHAETPQPDDRVEKRQSRKHHLTMKTGAKV